MFARIHSAVVSGPVVQPVTMEFEGTRSGLPGIHIVGLPHASVLESRERVLSALRSSGVQLPRLKITVNLLPVEVPKSGASLDLGLALGLLILAGEIPQCEYAALGELSLDGAVRSGRSFPLLAEKLERSSIYVGAEQAEGYTWISHQSNVFPVSSLSELLSVLRGHACARSVEQQYQAQTIIPHVLDLPFQRVVPGVLDVLRTTVAGGHHLLLYGAPGTGKTLVRQLLPFLLPETSVQERNQHRLETLLWEKVSDERVISPHHSATVTGLIGGGLPIQPGAITRAHQGVLFLDELPEFSRACLEALRQPLEDEKIELLRGNQRWILPASFTLIATSNPCPCGYWGGDRCSCSWNAVCQYLGKLSGPVLDRIDVQCPVPISAGVLLARQDLDAARAWVEQARARQAWRARSADAPLLNRSYQISDLTRSGVVFPTYWGEWLGNWRRKLKIMRLARTLADGDDNDVPQESHWRQAYAWAQTELPQVRATALPGRSLGGLP